MKNPILYSLLPLFALIASPFLAHGQMPNPHLLLPNYSVTVRPDPAKIRVSTDPRLKNGEPSEVSLCNQIEQSNAVALANAQVEAETCCCIVYLNLPTCSGGRVSGDCSYAVYPHCIDFEENHDPDPIN